MGPALCTHPVLFMKLLEANAKLHRVSAHLIQRDKPVVIVERSVLDPFRCRWARELLKLQHEFPRLVCHRGRKVHLEHEEGSHEPYCLPGVTARLKCRIQRTTDDFGIRTRKKA